MSTSQQHKNYRVQPKYQLSRANLPHPPPKQLSYKPTTRPKSKKSKGPVFLAEYTWVKKLLPRSQIVYNWKILQKKQYNNQIFIESWSNDGKQKMVSDACSWAFRSPKDHFLYLGNETSVWKLGNSHQYFSPGYPSQSDKELYNIISKLVNPILPLE